MIDVADTAALKASFLHTKSGLRSKKRKHEEKDSSDKIHDFRRIRVISLQNALRVDKVLDDGPPLGSSEQQGEKRDSGELTTREIAAEKAKKEKRGPQRGNHTPHRGGHFQPQGPDRRFSGAGPQSFPPPQSQRPRGGHFSNLQWTGTANSAK